MCDFELKVLDGLSSCGVDLNTNLKLGVAVSGGADSVSLLLSLSEIIEKFNAKQSIHVISVNHNIRPKQECDGDAKFVEELCKKLSDEGKQVCCSIVELAVGEVEQLKKNRGMSEEEAARFLRYKAFEKFIDNNQLDFLCLAHNKNDQEETVLMRFLSGASTEALAGIKNVRGKYIRPLIEISRREIEGYVAKKKVFWRTDATNFDTTYYRNKVRLKLIPFLNENFPGWNSAVLSAAKRRSDDASVISHLVDEVPLEVIEKNDETEVCLAFDLFSKLEVSIKRGVLLKAYSIVCKEDSYRVPSVFLEQFLLQIDKNKSIELRYKNVEFSLKNSKIFVKKYNKTHTETVFSAIIEEKGIYQFPFGFVTISDDGNFVINDEVFVQNVKLPYCVRSVQTDDEIKCADGKMKKIIDVFSDWHVPVQQRSSIPIIQNLNGKVQEIVGIAGELYGFSNWIVK